jgi:hypothetical protein
MKQLLYQSFIHKLMTPVNSLIALTEVIEKEVKVNLPQIDEQVMACQESL